MSINRSLVLVVVRSTKYVKYNYGVGGGGVGGGGVECSIFQNIDDGPIKWLPSGKRKKNHASSRTQEQPWEPPVILCPLS
jgi:hypothetical protein